MRLKRAHKYFISLKHEQEEFCCRSQLSEYITDASKTNSKEQSFLIYFQGQNYSNTQQNRLKL